MAQTCSPTFGTFFSPTSRVSYSVEFGSSFKTILPQFFLSPAVVFVSAAVVVLQLLAITGALFNWPTVLFAYVVITGLLGTCVGVVGIFGLVFSVLFGGAKGGGGGGGKSPNDHSRLFTILLVVAFILLFYLLTILGLKLMAYMRRRRGGGGGGGGGNRGGFENEGYGSGSGRGLSKRPYRHSPVARRAKRASYKSIDAISSPFTNNGSHQVGVDMGGGGDDDGELDDEYNVDYEEEDEDGDDNVSQELSQVYVDSGVPSLSTLLPPSPPSKSGGGGKGGGSSSERSQRPSSSAASFAFSI